MRVARPERPALGSLPPCSPPTPLRPRPTGRRCTRSSPSISRPTGQARASCRATTSNASWRSGGTRCSSTAISLPAGRRSTAARGCRRWSRSSSPRSSPKPAYPSAGPTTCSGSRCWATRCSNGAPTRRSRTTSRASCRARTAGARATRSRTPARTSATSAAERCSTVTSGSSTARRCGPRPGTWPTTSSCWRVPILTRPSTRASASCSSTCASPASRSDPSR